MYNDPCPCGRAPDYGACCGPLHHGERPAATAEELMRSRYSAYARRDVDYLFRTWHPRTRPTRVNADPGVEWIGLDVTRTRAGSADDATGEVTFIAHYRADGKPGTLTEHSLFERRAGRWFYVDGD